MDIGIKSLCNSWKYKHPFLQGKHRVQAAIRRGAANMQRYS